MGDNQSRAQDSHLFHALAAKGWGLRGWRAGEVLAEIKSSRLRARHSLAAQLIAQPRPATLSGGPSFPVGGAEASPGREILSLGRRRPRERERGPVRAKYAPKPDRPKPLITQDAPMAAGQSGPRFWAPLPVAGQPKTKGNDMWDIFSRLDLADRLGQWSAWPASSGRAHFAATRPRASGFRFGRAKHLLLDLEPRR